MSGSFAKPMLNLAASHSDWKDRCGLHARFGAKVFRGRSAQLLGLRVGARLGVITDGETHMLPAFQSTCRAKPPYKLLPMTLTRQGKHVPAFGEAPDGVLPEMHLQGCFASDHFLFGPPLHPMRNSKTTAAKLPGARKLKSGAISLTFDRHHFLCCQQHNSLHAVRLPSNPPKNRIPDNPTAPYRLPSALFNPGAGNLPCGWSLKPLTLRRLKTSPLLSTACTGSSRMLRRKLG